MRKLMGGFFGFLRRNKQRKGFTLAEALVVLAIIGIIAVLVLPVITTRAQNRGFSLAYDAEVKEMLNSLEGLTLHENAKSFNETIMNVPLNVNGEVTEDQAADAIDADALEGARQYLQRYTKVARYCGNITTPCFAQNYSMYEGRVRGIFPLAGIVSGGQPYRVNGVDLNYGPMVCALLKNGMSLCISPQVTDSTGRMVRPVRGFIDLNGPKEPNVLGRDLRSFSMDLATRTITSPEANNVIEDNGPTACQNTECCAQRYSEGALVEPDVNGSPNECCETLHTAGVLVGDEYLKYCCTVSSDIADKNDPCCDYLRSKDVPTGSLPAACRDIPPNVCELFASGNSTYEEECCNQSGDPYWSTHDFHATCCKYDPKKCCDHKDYTTWWTPATKWNEVCCPMDDYKNTLECNQCSPENWIDDDCCGSVSDEAPIWRERCCLIDEYKDKKLCCSADNDGKNRKGENNVECCNDDAGLSSLTNTNRNPECCYIKQWFANCCDVASGQKGTGKKDRSNKTWEDHCCSQSFYANEEACCKADGKNGQGNVSQECCSFIENKNANCCEYMSQEDPSSPYGEYCCLSSSYDAEDPCCKVFRKGCPPTCEDEDYFSSHLSDCCQQAAYADTPGCCSNGRNIVTNDYTQVCCNASGLNNTIKDACCEAGFTPAGYTCPEPPCTDPDVHVGWGLRAGTHDHKWWFELPAGMTAKHDINGVKYEYILYDVVDGACTNCSEPKTISPNIDKDKGRGTGNNNFINLGGKKLYIKRVSSAPSTGDCPKYIFDDYGTPCDCSVGCTENKIHLKTKVKEVSTACGANSTREETYWIESDRDVDDDVVVTLSAYFQHMAIGSSTPESSDTNLISETLKISRGDKKSNEVPLVSHIYPNNTTIGYSDDLTCYDPSTIGYYFNVSISGNDGECYPDDFDGECPASVTTLDASWGCCNDWGEDKVRDSHNQAVIDACCQFPDLKEHWSLCGGCTPNNIRVDVDYKNACTRSWHWDVRVSNSAGTYCTSFPSYNQNLVQTAKVGTCKSEPNIKLDLIHVLAPLCHCSQSFCGYPVACKYCTDPSSVACQEFGGADMPVCENNYNKMCSGAPPGITDGRYCFILNPDMQPSNVVANITAAGYSKRIQNANGSYSATYTENEVADVTYTATADRPVDRDVTITLTYYEAIYDNSGTYTGKQGPKTKTAKISKGGTSVSFSFSPTWNKRIVDVSISSDDDGDNGCFPTDNPAGSRPKAELCAEYEDDRSNPQWSSLDCCSLDDYYADASCCNGKYDGKGDVSATCCQKFGTFSGPEDECCNKVTNHNDTWLGGCCRRESGIMMADSEECCSFAGKKGEITSSDHPCCSIESIAEQYEVCQTPCDKVAAGTATEAEKKACCDAALSNSSIDHGAWTGRMSEWAQECCLVKNGNKYAYAGATPGMYIYADYTLELPGACCPYWQHENVLVYDEAAYNADPAHLAGACYMYDEACIKENFGFAAIANNVKGVCWLPCYNADGTPDTTKALYCCDKWYADGKFNNGANSALKDTCCNEPINKTWDICNTTACPSANDATPARATKECCSEWLTGANISTMLHPDRHDALAACCANDEWAEENPHAGYCCDITPHSSYITACEIDECYSVAYRLDCGVDGTPTLSYPGPSSCANVSNVKCKLTMDKPQCAEKVNGSTEMCVTVNYETTAYNASCGSVNTCTALTQCGPDSVTILPAAYVYTFDGKGKFHWNADGANEVITGINGGLDGATTCSPWLYDSSYPVREIKGGLGSIYYSRSFSIINGQYRQ